jgi:AraC-like DNA-binding protein
MLPTIWLIVGSLLIVITLIAVVLFLVKSREVATLKKEVLELRDTMRMMRYEELNLSRMLHTADKSAPTKEELDEQPQWSEPDEEESAPVEEHPLVIAEEPTEEPTEEAAEEVDEAVDEEPTQEVAEAVEEAAEDEIIEEVEETVEEDVAEAVEEETVEEETVEEIEPEAEEVADEVAEASEEIVEEVIEETEVPVPSGKQPINGRRPAIPTDLFAAWFEENESAEPEASSPSTAEVEPLAPQSVHAPVSAPAEQEVAVPTASVAPAADDTEATLVVEPVEPVAESGEPTEVQAPSIVLSKEDERFCRKLERIVNARMRNPNLNIDVIAAQFGIGRTNFYRKVRELMGMSPNDYLRRCRMERAAELLRTTDLPVSDVCVQIGVPDAQYFSRVFKTFYGVTPTAYREQA